MDRCGLAEAIRVQAYIEGEFVLRSGLTTGKYLDKYQFEADPYILRAVTAAMVPLIPVDIDLLAGLELGGIPIATMLSQLTGLPTAFVRKARKSHGTRRLAEGADVEHKRTLIVEDVTSTGGQIITSAIELRRLGSVVDHAIVVVDRSQGYESRFSSNGILLHSLFSIDEIING